MHLHTAYHLWVFSLSLTLKIPKYFTMVTDLIHCSYASYEDVIPQTREVSPPKYILHLLRPSRETN